MSVLNVNQTSPKPVRLRLNTLENTRRSFSRILRAFYDGNLDEAKYKATVYGLAQYLGYWRLCEEVKANEKLDELLGKLKERGIE